MSTLIYIKENEWDKEMYETKCVCGHELYLHAFVQINPFVPLGESIALRTSQCTVCEYDEENKKFLCEGFN